MVSTTPNEVAQNRNTTLAADTMPGTRAGSVTVRNTCHGTGAEHGRSLLAASVDRLPERPDRAYDDADVEEDERGHDRRGRPVEPERAERTGGRDQLAEGDADDHRRQHERHHHQRTQQVTAGEAQPVQHERDRESRGHRHEGRDTGRPDGEPEHPVRARAPEHLHHTAEVEGPVRPESAREHADDRVDEEQHERSQRHRGDRHGAPPHAERHWLVTSRHSRSHVVRFLVTSAGSTEYGCGETGAYDAQSAGSFTDESTG